VFCFQFYLIVALSCVKCVVCLFVMCICLCMLFVLPYCITTATGLTTYLQSNNNNNTKKYV
jgi:hypothetical protein